jgi:hypothetical protein
MNIFYRGANDSSFYNLFQSSFIGHFQIPISKPFFLFFVQILASWVSENQAKNKVH